MLRVIAATAASRPSWTVLSPAAARRAVLDAAVEIVMVIAADAAQVRPPPRRT